MAVEGSWREDWRLGIGLPGRGVSFEKGRLIERGKGTVYLVAGAGG